MNSCNKSLTKVSWQEVVFHGLVRSFATDNIALASLGFSFCAVRLWWHVIAINEAYHCKIIAFQPRCTHEGSYCHLQASWRCKTIPRLFPDSSRTDRSRATIQSGSAVLTPNGTPAKLLTGLQLQSETRHQACVLTTKQNGSFGGKRRRNAKTGADQAARRKLQEPNFSRLLWIVSHLVCRPCREKTGGILILSVGYLDLSNIFLVT